MDGQMPQKVRCQAIQSGVQLTAIANITNGLVLWANLD